MSATPSDSQTNPPETLSGDFIAIAAVTNPGVSSSETEPEEENIIGQTMGDVEFERDAEAVEATLHGTEITQQHAGHATMTLNFTLAAVPNQPQLQTLEIYDDTGAWIGPADWDAIRVYVYADEPDLESQASDSWELWGCEVDTELPAYATGDPGEIPMVVRINGGHMHGNSKPDESTTS